MCTLTAATTPPLLSRSNVAPWENKFLLVVFVNFLHSLSSSHFRARLKGNLQAITRPLLAQTHSRREVRHHSIIWSAPSASLFFLFPSHLARCCASSASSFFAKSLLLFQCAGAFKPNPSLPPPPSLVGKSSPLFFLPS